MNKEISNQYNLEQFAFSGIIGFLWGLIFSLPTILFWGKFIEFLVKPWQSFHVDNLLYIFMCGIATLSFCFLFGALGGYLGLRKWRNKKGVIIGSSIAGSVTWIVMVVLLYITF